MSPGRADTVNTSDDRGSPADSGWRFPRICKKIFTVQSGPWPWSLGWPVGATGFSPSRLHVTSLDGGEPTGVLTTSYLILIGIVTGTTAVLLE